MPTPWWRDAVVYQIYPRSFADANGDGIGDLAGITSKLDYLADLGVDALWLSPIFTSPMRDFGYDVADYCGIDPVFGTDTDFDDLITGLHDRGMRLLLDWVPNHSSDQHPWFVESRSSRNSPKRDWYVWEDAQADGSPPNNWQAMFKQVPAWTHDIATDQSYLHLFLAEQPDLNWANPEVEAAMHDTLRYWLDRGVDGFRADVVNLIGKGTDVPDLPEPFWKFPLLATDRPFGHELLRRIRSLLDGYDHEPMMVGEVYLLRDGESASYVGTPDAPELHLSFDFRPLHSPWDADRMGEALAKMEDDFAEPRWPTFVLSNHDQVRHRSRYGSEARARAAAVVALSARGTPFLYAGEELGLEDAVVPDDRVVDPDGRDGCRAPIPWTADGDCGDGPRLAGCDPGCRSRSTLRPTPPTSRSPMPTRCTRCTAGCSTCGVSCPCCVEGAWTSRRSTAPRSGSIGVWPTTSSRPSSTSRRRRWRWPADLGGSDVEVLLSTSPTRTGPSSQLGADEAVVLGRGAAAGSDPFEVALPFPVGHRRLEGLDLDLEELHVVVGDGRAEGLANQGAVREALGCVFEGAGHAWQIRGRVHVTLERRWWLDLLLDATEPARECCGVGEVRVAVGAGDPALDPEARALADHPESGGAIVLRPGDARGRPRPVDVALVGVDRRRVERHEVGGAGHPAAEEPAEHVAAISPPTSNTLVSASASHRLRWRWLLLPASLLDGFAMNVTLSCW